MRTVKGVDDTMRLHIIDEYLSGASKYSLIKKYKLSGSKQLNEWMRTFGIEDPNHCPRPLFIMAKEEIESSKPEEVKKLELEIRKLRKELAYEKMKADAYDTMIDVAEEMFQIPIRKKPDTKQSKD